MVFYAVKVVGGELSTEGFGTDEKEYAKLVKWILISDLRTTHYACSIDIAGELADFVEKMTNEISKE